ncbi:MAG: hypothetical protein BJG00_004135 [Limnothrix sp. CACIAM 69d]|nr:MAG: hypothetical protein BJG00_004135 [Limnothrix sp. CACIAM 69d]
MSKLIWKALLASPAILGAAVVAASPASAQQVSSTTVPSVSALEATGDGSTLSNLDQLNQYGREGRARRANSAEQVTSVSQLSDVQPTDWAFQALQSLVERYGCIAGYPDGTYKGNRAMTRYEFAAGLNACLDRIQELLVTNVADYATKADLEVLKKLQDMFKTELAALRGRVDTLEGRISYLEKTQFSTTTKLTGEAIMMLAGATSANLDDLGDAFSGNNGDDNQVVFQNRVRLNFNTSFSGKDLLITRLQVGNSKGFNGVAGETVLTNQVFGDTGNQFTLDTLQYQFPIGEKGRGYLMANAGVWDDISNTLNPYFEDYDGGRGSLSTFSQRSPIYRLGGGAGIGVKYDFSDNWQLSAGYLAGEAANPRSGDGVGEGGLFDGQFSAMAQLTYTNDAKTFGLGLTYNYSYFGEGEFGFDNAGFVSGFTGTLAANVLPQQDAVTSNSVGLQGYYQFSPKVALTGFVGYTGVDSKGGSFDDADIWYYALGLALPDLGKEGNLGGIFVGAQPYLTNIDGDDVKTDIPLQVEVFYKYAVNDWISITPGVIWQVNPNQDNDNDDVVIGTLRTTFVF